MNLKQKIRFYEQLSTLTRAGVPLRQGLQGLTNRLPGTAIKKLAREIDQGAGIAQAFKDAGFSLFEINLIEAGEKSGRLDHIFPQLVQFWKSDLQLVRSIRRQSAYPLLLVHVAAVLGPITLILESPITYVLAVASQLGTLYLGVAVAYCLIRASWRTGIGQAIWLRIPLIGSFWKATYAYRWTIALQMEFGSGIPLPQAVRDAWRATGYISREQFAQEAESQLNAGEPLSHLMREWPHLPSDWAGYVETGEQAGKLEETFDLLRGEAELNWNARQATLSEWLPRLGYFVIIIIVACQILSAYLKYFGQINDLINSVP